MCKECLPANRAAGVRKKTTGEAQDFLLICHLLFIKGVNLPKSCLLNCDIWETGLNKQVCDLFLIQQVVKSTLTVSAINTLGTYFTLSFPIKSISCFGQRSELAVKIEVFSLCLAETGNFQRVPRKKKEQETSGFALYVQPNVYEQQCLVYRGFRVCSGQCEVLMDSQPCCCLLPGWHKQGKALLVVFIVRKS